MSVLDREALEQSPLADLHAIASELSLDGYRRLRKPDLIGAIIENHRHGAIGDNRACHEPKIHAERIPIEPVRTDKHQLLTECRREDNRL